MSRLDELISKYCPNGVEFVELDSIIISLNTGLNPRKFFKLNTYDATNYYITIREIQNNNVVFSEKTDRINDEAMKLCNNRSNLESGDILFSGTGTIGATALIKETPRNWNIKEGVYVIKPKQDKLESKFLMYILQSENVRNAYMKKVSGGTVKSIPMKEMRKLLIPLPQIEVQREIVRILDNFTEITEELKTKLSEELIARNKQYEYYQNEIFFFKNNENVKWVRLREIADIGTGSSNTNEGLEVGKYPFFVRSQEVRRKNEYEFDETAIITAGDGVGVGKVLHYVEGKYALHQRAYRIHINSDTVIPKYFYHYMKGTFLTYIQKAAVNSSVTSIRRKMLEDYPVPIPDLGEQQKILDILDRFDSLCNDISKDIPAEIEARQKQYEYYRDKLLTFKELKKEGV